MRTLIGGNPERLRRAMAFVFSAALHASALGWIAIGATLLSGEKEPGIYAQEIKPYETHIVWYGAHDPLPDVTPAAPKASARRPRAIREFKQQIVSRSREDDRARQKILLPAPEMRLPKALPLPNVLAVESVLRPLRAFIPPEAKRIARAAPLPDPPPVAASAPMKELALARPQAPLLPFKPPEAKRSTPAPVDLPAAPQVSTSAPVKDLAVNLVRPQAPLLPFKPPEAKRSAPAPVDLPAAPQVSTSAPVKDLAVNLVRPQAPLLPFKAPETKRGAPAAPPQVNLSAEAPPPALAPPVVQPAMVVVSLHPAEVPNIPTPPGSHEAGFSAGPKSQPEGGDSDAKSAALSLSGLLTRGGIEEARAQVVASLASPTSHQSLMEGLRRDRNGISPGPAMAATNAARLSTPPDARLAGRPVYVMAVQMPNITSDSGSWMVWFAERYVQSGSEPALDVLPPVPVYEVDPKYIASAREERVEGVVRLYAIIRKTGEVDSVELLKRVDPRLDRSSVEALLKWRFEPAKRDGVPVDVDAIFEVPFRLKAREKR